ncbi:hypothetical protein ERJ75_001547500 [Trypanosoma vivax]|nr:hypothetical protein ERJ75_001547500 [Trypanosoma vivax]
MPTSRAAAHRAPPGCSEQRAAWSPPVFLPPALLVLGTGRARGARPRVSTLAAGSRAQAREGLPQGEARVRDVGVARRPWHERPGLSGSVASLEGDGGG